MQTRLRYRAEQAVLRRRALSAINECGPRDRAWSALEKGITRLALHARALRFAPCPAEPPPPLPALSAGYTFLSQGSILLLLYFFLVLES